ncbi:MAG: hypothetical protein KBD63_05960 [Bacteriovoracaceae bacterium]|nr:hypothetical protein [Bacteriovoracaceae bacterium]
MTTYRINIDYEHFLFKKDYNSQAYQIFNQDFEFVFFFLNKDKSVKLQNQKNYSLEYLQFIKELGGEVPVFTAKEGLAWWGQLKDIDLERKLNSKIESFLFSLKNKQTPTYSSLISHYKEVEENVRQHSFKWVIKNPHEMSGRGNFFVQKVLDEKATFWIKSQLQQNSLIMEPWLDRIVDIGSFYNGNFFNQHIILNDQRGVFRGIKLYNHSQDLFQDPNLKNLEKVSEHINVTQERALQWLKDQTIGSMLNLEFGIDSFFYKDFEQEVSFYPWVEINFRKTMGAFAHAVKELLPPYKVVELHFLPVQKVLQSYVPHPDEFFYRLSPADNKKIAVYVIGAYHEEGLTNLKKKLKLDVYSSSALDVSK